MAVGSHACRDLMLSTDFFERLSAFLIFLTFGALKFFLDNISTPLILNSIEQF